MDCSLPGSSVHGDSPGKNTGVGCLALLQGIFPTQGSNPALPNCRCILCQLSYQGSLPSTIKSLIFVLASLVAQIVKNLPATRKTWVDPWVEKIPWRREWQPTPIFLPGESHGQRSLVGYRPQGCKESDMTELLTHICIPYHKPTLKLCHTRNLTCTSLDRHPELSFHQRSGVRDS